jgi:hypothetical protein
MTSWTQREFESMADAISIHLETIPGQVAVGEVLSHIPFWGTPSWKALCATSELRSRMP